VFDDVLADLKNLIAVRKAWLRDAGTAVQDHEMLGEPGHLGGGKRGYAAATIRAHLITLDRAKPSEEPGLQGATTANT
jgi:hypothetical protein